MPARYAFSRRLKLRGDSQVAASFVARGDTLLGIFLNQLGEAGIRSGRRRFVENGVVYVVGTDGSTPFLEIEVEAKESAVAITVASLWVPRGFVVRPATDAAPFGWGMPIVPRASAGPYDLVNLAPGTNVSRWTPGGPLADVLLTRVVDAGYPPRLDTIAPVLFNSDVRYGPQPTTKQARLDETLDAATGPYAGFRPEFNAYEDAGQIGVMANRRAIFELTNNHRQALGRDPVALPLRGLYSAAQTYTDMSMQKGLLAHYAADFYPTFKTPPDRNAKDGAPRPMDKIVADDRNKILGVGENVNVAAQSVTPIGTDPDGEPIYRVSGVLPLTPGDAFASWLTSPSHKATIESAEWNGHSTCLDTGNTAGFYAQDFARRSQWIGCGNAVWHSQDPEIPPLSWHSFHAMNLAFETWPIAYTYVGDEAVLGLRTPLCNATTGVFWMNYCRGKTSLDYEYVSPALQSGIYMRGRLIAVAPHGGLVLAAAIEKLPAPALSTGVQMYRLKALVHVPADQPSNQITNGCTAILHAYYVDLPNVRGFAAHADSTIRGVRGSPATSDPWIEADDPWSWTDAGTIDVGTTDGATRDLLMYGQLWRFNAAGTQAVCLRRQYTAAQLAADITDATGFQFTFGAGFNRVLTIDFDAAPVLTVLPPLAGNTVTNYEPDAASIKTFGFASTYLQDAVAIDYAPNGSLSVVYSGRLSIGVADVDGLTLAFPLSVQVIGKGGTMSRKIEDLQQRATLAYYTFGQLNNVAVLDVNDGVFTTEEMTPAYVWSVLDDGDTAHSHFKRNPGVNNCWLYTSQHLIKVSVWRQFARLRTDGYSNSDGAIVDTYNVCLELTGAEVPVGFGLISSTSSFVQGSYAKARSGDWILSYVVAPQPGVARKNVGGVTGDCYNADGGDQPCRPSLTDVIQNAVTLSLSDLAPRGGWCTASFADQDQLAQLTGAQGANLRFPVIGVV